MGGGKRRAGWWFWAAVVVLLATQFRICYLSGWDEAFYWTQLTSLFYDGDLALHDDLLATFNPPAEQYRALRQLNADGALPNTFSFGTVAVDGLLLGPVVWLERLLGLGRFSMLFIYAAAVAALLKIALLAWGLRHLATAWLPEGPGRRRAALAVLFGTPLAAYAFRFYGMSHLNSALAATGFLVVFTAWWRARDPWRDVALGLAAGVLTLVRWQNCLYGLAVLPLLAARWRELDGAGRRRFAAGLARAGAAAVLTVSLQAAAWWRQFGHAFYMPQGGGYVRWGRPCFRPLLTAGFHGLLPWSPLFALAAVGLAWGSLRRRGSGTLLLRGALLTLLAATYVNACPEDWWGGLSYGARRFCALAPLAALGTAELFRRLGSRLSWVLFAALALWAHVTLTAFDAGVDDLALPLLGRPSRTEHRTDGAMLTDAAAARRALAPRLAHLPAPGIKLLRLPRPWRPLDVALSLAVIAGLPALVAVAMTRRRRWERPAVAAAGAWLAALLLALLFRVPAAHPVNRPWLDFVEGRLEADGARRAGAPDGAVRLVEALEALERGADDRLAMLLKDVNTRDLRALRPEALRAILAAPWTRAHR